MPVARSLSLLENAVLTKLFTRICVGYRNLKLCVVAGNSHFRVVTGVRKEPKGNKINTLQTVAIQAQDSQKQFT